MANKKFSEFELKTTTSDVSHIVGYNGTDNVQITPANFVTTGGTGVFLPLAGGTMTGALVVDSTATINDILTAGLGLALTGGTVGSGKLVLASTNKVHLSGGTAGLVLQNTSGTNSLTIDTNSTFTGDVLINTTGGYFEVDTAENRVKFADNTKATFGTGQDLQIYHDGSHSYIEDSGTGDLRIKTDGSSIAMLGNGNSDMLLAIPNGAVNLYYNNSRKFQTTNTGVSVTGNIGTSGSVFFDDNQGINFGNSNAKINGSSSDGIKFFGTGSEKMRLTQGGDLGLGTSFPSGKIEVVQTGSGTDNTIITQDNARKIFIGRDSIKATDLSNNATILNIQQNGGNATFGGKIILPDNIEIKGTTFSSSFLKFSSSTTLSANDNIIFNANGVEKMRLTSAGNLGIGLTNPDQKLDVDGNVKISSEKYYYVSGTGAGFGSDASGNFKIRQNDADLIFGSGNNVGIGVDAPKSKLHILEGTAGSYTPISDADTLIVESETAGGISLVGTGSGSNGNTKIVFGTLSDLSGAQLEYSNNNSYLRIGTTSASNTVQFMSGNGVECMRLDASGNLGLGLTNPGRILDVKASGGDQGIGLVQSGTDIRIFQAIQTGTGDGAILLTKADGSDLSTIRGQGDSSLNGGDLKLGTASAGLVLKSANGTQYKITVADNGTVTSTAV